MKRTWEGKVALVTGAGKGSGRRMAQALAGLGASIAANDISPVNLDETAAGIRANAGQVRTYVEDISKKMMVQGLLNRVLEDLGRIDLLVNCAEVEPQKSVIEMDDWDWQRVLDVNLTGPFLLIQSTARIMKENGGGRILLLGDRAHSREKHSAYFASKRGLEALAAAAGEELTAAGVEVSIYDKVEDALEALSR